MARKDLLKGLMSPGEEASPSPAPTQRPSYSKGAIGAVSKSIASLKSRSVVELDPNQIGDAGLPDRLEHDEEDHQRLMASLRDHGQQVPILVRPDPQDDERYQIVYGRRRVLALRDLGLPVKAMIRDLDDAGLVMAQGQENNARKNLSFIEKANFARQMAEAGYDRKAICDAINVDKTVISRMMQVTDALPQELIHIIGAAPSAGRDRWLVLSRLWAMADDIDTDLAADMVTAAAVETSDERFRTVIDWLESRETAVPKSKNTRKSKALSIRDADGTRIASLKKGANATTLTFNNKTAAGFDDWIAERLTELHQDWLASREDGSN